MVEFVQTWTFGILMNSSNKLNISATKSPTSASPKQLAETLLATMQVETDDKKLNDNLIFANKKTNRHGRYFKSKYWKHR